MDKQPLWTRQGSPADPSNAPNLEELGVASLGDHQESEGLHRASLVEVLTTRLLLGGLPTYIQ